MDMCEKLFGYLLAVELLGHEVCASSALLDIEDYFPKWWY